MKSFHHFVPSKSINILQSWIDDLDAKIVISNPRKTKLGDFKYRKNRFIVSVNNNLNPYSFLITLTHELAHAFVYKKYKNTVKAHGESWQLTYKYMMLNFLNKDCFPDDVLKVLSQYIIKPKASSFSDLDLVDVLRKYNQRESFVISDIKQGDTFLLPNGKIFKKGKKLRKRFVCTQFNTGKRYSFHPFTEVIK